MHVVPHRPATDSVVLWIQAEPRETGWSLAVDDAAGAQVAAWSPDGREPVRLPNVAIGVPDTHVWQWPVTGLAAGVDHIVRFVGAVAAGEEVAATFRTLPTGLDAPFVVLLGSCYAEDSDLPDPVVSQAVRASGEQRLLGPLLVFVQQVRHAIGGVRALFRRGPVTGRPRGHVSRRYETLLGSADRPDLKILVGDQVYLDAPWYWFLGVPLPGSPVVRHISATYSRTWEKLGWMLSRGANILVSDDHEFWNDYPFRPPLLTVFTKLWLPAFRGRWEGAARRFLEAVQLPQALTPFSIGDDLEFLVVDTRIHRDGDGFMAEPDLAAVLDWLVGLRAPGVLALGQPVLGPAESVKRGVLVTDHNLPAYPGQYGRLCRALAAAPHDVLVLAGDVHYGRVVEVEVPRADRAAPGRIVEVVSSPMALVKLAGGRFDAPDVAPGLRLPRSWCPDFAPRVPGVVEEAPVLRSVATVARPDGGPGHCPDHYTTLAFSRGERPGEVAVVVTARSLEPGQDEGADPVLLRTRVVLARHDPDPATRGPEPPTRGPVPSLPRVGL